MLFTIGEAAVDYEQRISKTELARSTHQVIREVKRDIPYYRKPWSARSSYRRYHGFSVTAGGNPLL